MKQGLGLGIAFVLSLIAAAMPKAWLGRFEGRVDRDSTLVVAASSGIQFVSFAAVFVAGFFAYMNELSVSYQGALETSLLGITPITPFVYALTTLQGFVGTLGALGGAGRLIYLGVFSRGAADPTLTTLETLRAMVLQSGRSRLREASKGPRVCDHVITADEDAPWQLRITTCDDLGWYPGCPVLAFGALHRVTSTCETRDESGRLRIVHELRKMAGAEGTGGFRRYEPELKPRVVAAPATPSCPELGPEDQRGIPLAAPKRSTPRTPPA